MGHQISAGGQGHEGEAVRGEGSALLGLQAVPGLDGIQITPYSIQIGRLKIVIESAQYDDSSYAIYERYESRIHN